MAFDVSFVYRIIDKYSAQLQKIHEKTEGFSKKVRGLGDRMAGLASRAGVAFSAVNAAVVALPVRAAIEFEQAVSDIDKAFDFDSVAARATFLDDLREMAPDLGLTSTEMAKLVFEAGKLGIASDDVLRFAEVSSMASTAFDGLPIEEAGQVIGDLKTRFGLAVDGVEGMLDAVNTLADNTNVNGGQILTVLGRMSGQFAALEFPPELAAGFSAFARQIAVSDELAASGMNMFLRQLDQAALAADPLGTITETLEELATLDIATRADVIKEIFGQEASGFVQGLVSNLDTLDSTLANVADSANFAGSMTGEFQNKSGTAAFAISQFWSELNNLQITMGETILPTVTEFIRKLSGVIDRVSKFAKANPEITKFSVVFAAVAAAIVPVVAGLGLVLAAVGPIGIAIGLVGAAFVAAWALAGDFCEGVKNIANAIIEAFQPVTDLIGGAFDAVSSFGAGFADFLGFGGGAEQTAAAATGNLTAQAANTNNVQLQGQIDINAAAPAQVREARITSNPPGNLGLNVGAAR